MQVAAAGTGVRLSDGSTNVMPVGSPEAIRAAVRAARADWCTRSLRAAYYQGWDMHPGHLVSRYLATYAFYRSGPTHGSRTAQGLSDTTESAVVLSTNRRPRRHSRRS